MVLGKFYRALCELPLLAKFPIILGMSAGLAYVAAHAMQRIENSITVPPVPVAPFMMDDVAERVTRYITGPPSQRIMPAPAPSLEEALDRTLDVIEVCPENLQKPDNPYLRIERTGQSILVECLRPETHARVFVREKGLDFYCYFQNCLRDITAPIRTVEEWRAIVEWGEPAPKDRTFPITYFKLNEYHSPDAPPGTFDISVPYHGSFVGAIGVTPTLKAAIDDARTRVNRLEGVRTSKLRR